MGKRVSLILKDADEAAIAPFLDADSPSFEVLRKWAHDRGESEVKSEAGALRALLKAGAQVLRDEALEAGYAQLAEEINSESAHTERRAARSRYVRRTAAQP